MEVVFFLDADPLFLFLIDNFDEFSLFASFTFSLSCGCFGGCWFIEGIEICLLVGLKMMSNNRIDGERY